METNTTGPIIQSQGNRIVVRTQFHHSPTVKKLRSGKWNPKDKVWEFINSPSMANTLLESLAELNPVCDEQIEELAAIHKNGSKIKQSEDLPDIPNSKTKAWIHQRRGFHFAKNLPGAMLAMDMGTGKSKTAVGLVQNGPHTTTLILCPKSVIPVWPLEFKTHADETFHITTLVKGTTFKKMQQADIEMKKAAAMKRPFVLVVNYDTYWREPLDKWLLKQSWDVIVYDESHRIKSPTGKASKFAQKLYRTSSRRYALTGTPMPHSPLDIWAQYRVIDPSIFGTSFHRFKLGYARMGGFNNKQVVEFINQEDLSQKFESIAFRVGKEVLDLPEATHNFRTFDLGAKAKKAYKQVDEELYAEIEGDEVSVANAMVKVLRLQQLTGGYLPADEGGLIQMDNGKLALLKEVLEEIPQDEPVVIFARFTKDLQGIREVCEEIGRTTSELSGSENSLEEWQAGQTNALAVQIRSGGVGINLTRACFNIYYSVGHSLGDYTQSLARSHRPGQNNHVRYYHLLAQGTIDPVVYQALQSKKEVIDVILENGGKTKDSI